MPSLVSYYADPNDCPEDVRQFYREPDPSKGEPAQGLIADVSPNAGWGLVDRRAAQQAQRSQEDLTQHLPEGYDLAGLRGDLDRLKQLEEASQGQGAQEEHYRKAVAHGEQLQQRIDFLERDLAITDELAKHGQDMRLRKMLRDEVEYEQKDGQYTFFALDDRGKRVEVFNDETGQMETKGVEHAVKTFLDGDLGSRLAQTNQQRVGGDTTPSPHTEQNGTTGPRQSDEQLMQASNNREAYKQAQQSRGLEVPTL